MLNVMLFFTGILVFVFGLCPGITLLWCVSPLNKLINLERKVDDYSDLLVYGLPIWGVIAFTVGWIVVLLKVCHVI